MAIELKPPVDFCGRPIKVGDSVVYVTARRDVAFLNKAIVEKILVDPVPRRWEQPGDRWSFRVRAVQGGRLIKLKFPDRIIIVPYVFKVELPEFEPGEAR